MNSVGKSNLIKIYYKADDLETGLSIVYNIWDDQGNTLATNTPATAEVGTRGIYYLEFTTPSSDVYVFVKAGLSNNTKNVPIILRVGSPVVQKLFFVDPAFVASKVISYQIFDISVIVAASGNLTDENNGFYSTDVSSLSNGTYFFEVIPFISKFNIPLDLEFVESTCPEGDASAPEIMINVRTSGGGASKARHSVFDPGFEKSRIDARLIYDSDNDKIEGVAFLTKEKEGKKAPKKLENVQGLLVKEEDKKTEIKAVLIST